MNLAHLSDAEIVSELDACCFRRRELTARVLVLLAGVEERRIHLKAAYSSLFDYCVRRLRMSDGQAYRHVAGARLVRRYPFLLDRIERGEVFLSTLALFHKQVTDENVEELVAATTGKKRAQVEIFLARRFGRAVTPVRYGAPFIMDEELFALMKRASELMSHAVPDGDLLELTKRAYRALIEKAEKAKRAKVAQPRAANVETRDIPHAVRREVFERDGEQCTYHDEATGERCPARAFLELDHVDARALGGANEPRNLRVRCRAHNRLHAEETFGAAYVARRIHLRQRKWQVTTTK